MSTATIITSAYFEQERKATPISKKILGWFESMRQTDTTYIKPEILPEVEVFSYPPLGEIRSELEACGLYSESQIVEMMKGYEQLPEYQNQAQSS